MSYYLLSIISFIVDSFSMIYFFDHFVNILIYDASKDKRYICLYPGPQSPQSQRSTAERNKRINSSIQFNSAVQLNSTIQLNSQCGVHADAHLRGARRCTLFRVAE